MSVSKDFTSRHDAKIAAVNAASGDKDATTKAIESLAPTAPTNRTPAQDAALIQRADAARDAANAGSGGNRTDVSAKVAASVNEANKKGGE